MAINTQIVQKKFLLSIETICLHRYFINFSQQKRNIYRIQCFVIICLALKFEFGVEYSEQRSVNIFPVCRSTLFGIANLLSITYAKSQICFVDQETSQILYGLVCYITILYIKSINYSISPNNILVCRISIFW